MTEPSTTVPQDYTAVATRDAVARIIYEATARVEYGDDHYPFEDPCAPSQFAYVAADTILALLSQQQPPDGGAGEWVTVPREPTEAMIEATRAPLEPVTAALQTADKAGHIWTDAPGVSIVAEAYRAMIDAAPAAPVQPPAPRVDDAGLEAMVKAFCRTRRAQGYALADTSGHDYLDAMRAALAAAPALSAGVGLDRETVARIIDPATFDSADMQSFDRKPDRLTSIKMNEARAKAAKIIALAAGVREEEA